MNRIINDPEQVADEAIRGVVLAYPDILAATDHPRVLRAAKRRGEGKVGIVTGGGSGHEPAFLGFVGAGLCDAVACGEIFASPTAKSFHEAFKAADSGAGVACLYGNYAGDNMNVKMAVKLAAKDGITVRTVVANDDVASAPRAEREKRRGVAGEIIMWKTAGARADEGGTLDEVIAVGQKAIDNTGSVGIGLSACTIPAAGKPNFTIAPGMMEVGIGHHGEPGVAVMPVQSARDMAALMMERILEDTALAGGEDGHVTAAAPDVEDAVPGLDPPAGQQPRRQPGPHSLVPLALLDEVPPAGSVPGLRLGRIHHHAGHAMP